MQPTYLRRRSSPPWSLPLETRLSPGDRGLLAGSRVARGWGWTPRISGFPGSDGASGVWETPLTPFRARGRLPAPRTVCVCVSVGAGEFGGDTPPPPILGVTFGARK